MVSVSIHHFWDKLNVCFLYVSLFLSTVPNLDKGIEFVNKHYTSKSEHPLALYIFSKDKKEQQKIMKAVPSGTAAINDVLKQAGNVYLVSTKVLIYGFTLLLLTNFPSLTGQNWNLAIWWRGYFWNWRLLWKMGIRFL